MQMSMDYHRKTGKYILPKAVYHQVIWRIRDYYRLKDNLESLSVLSPIQIDDMPKSQTNKANDVVFSLVVQRDKFLDEINCIEKPLKVIPEEYRKAVWENIQFQKAFPIYAARSTYSRYKSRYIYQVADLMDLI